MDRALTRASFIIMTILKDSAAVHKLVKIHLDFVKKIKYIQKRIK